MCMYYIYVYVMYEYKSKTCFDKRRKSTLYVMCFVIPHKTS